MFRTMTRKVEQIRKVPGGILRVPRIGQAGVGIPQLVEKWMAHGLNRA